MKFEWLESFLVLYFVVILIWGKFFLLVMKEDCCEFGWIYWCFVVEMDWVGVFWYWLLVC